MSEKRKGREEERERGENVQCHWDQTTIEPVHLPRKTTITNNTEGERGREREKQTGRDGKRGGEKRQMLRNRSRRTKKDVKKKGENKEIGVKWTVCVEDGDDDKGR